MSVRWCHLEICEGFLDAGCKQCWKARLEKNLVQISLQPQFISSAQTVIIRGRASLAPLAHYSPNAPYNGDEPRKSPPWIPYPAIWAAHWLAIGFKCFRGLLYYVTTETKHAGLMEYFCLSFISIASLTECDFWGYLLFWRSCDIARKEEQRLSAFPQFDLFCG